MEDSGMPKIPDDFDLDNAKKYTPSDLERMAMKHFCTAWKPRAIREGTVSFNGWELLVDRGCAVLAVRRSSGRADGRR